MCPPKSGGANWNSGGAAAKIFRALRARHFLPPYFFIACSTPGFLIIIKSGRCLKVGPILFPTSPSRSAPFRLLQSDSNGHISCQNAPNWAANLIYVWTTFLDPALEKVKGQLLTFWPRAIYTADSAHNINEEQAKKHKPPETIICRLVRHLDEARPSIVFYRL